MARNAVVSILIKAKDDASRVLGNIRAQFKGFGSELKGLFAGAFGELLKGAAVAKLLKDLVGQTIAWEQSLRALNGAAKVTGAPLDFIQHVASRVRKELSTSRIEANLFAEELVRLGAKAGDLTQIDTNFQAIFDTLTAQGFQGRDALAALEAAVQGNDRVIKKLFNTRPETLFEQFATSIGKTTEQLSEAERAMAIFDRFAKEGKKTQGELARSLASTEEKLGDVGEAFSDVSVTAGTKLTPAMRAVATVAIFLINVLGGTVAIVEALGAVFGAMFFSTVEAVKGIGSAIAAVARGDIPSAIASVSGAATNIKNIWSGAADSVQESLAAAFNPAVVEGFDQAAFEAANKLVRETAEQQAREHEAAERLKKAQQEAEEARKRAAAEAEQERKNAVSNELALLDIRAEQATLSDAETQAIAERLNQLRAQLDVEASLATKLSEKLKIQSERLKLEEIADKLIDRQIARQNALAEQELAAAREKEEHQRLANSQELRNIQLKIALRQDTAADAARLKTIEQDLLQQLRAKNLTLEEEIRLRERLNEVVETEKSLNDNLTQFSDGLRQAVAGPLAEFFANGIKGFDSLGDAVAQFARAVTEAIANLLAQIAANSILQQIFGTGLSLATGGGVTSKAGGSSSGIGKAFADGGIVTGPGGPRDDAVLARLSAGEGVLSARAVATLGGPAAVNFLNTLGQAASARLPRFADGGAVGDLGGGAGSGGDRSIVLGLEDGLVVKHMDSLEGENIIIKKVVKNRRRLGGSMGRGPV